MKNRKLFQSSLILFVGGMVVNIGNYFYNIISGRFLGPEGYGILASLISFFYLLTIPTNVIKTVVSRFTSIYNVKKESEKIYSLWWALSRRLLFIGIGIVIILILFSSKIASFLNIPSIYPVVFICAPLFLFLVIPINRGIIWGMQKFTGLALNNIIEVLVKLFFTVVLILVGFSVNGAVLAIFLGVFVAYFFSFGPIKAIFKNRKKVDINVKDIKMYSFSAFWAFLFLTAIFNLDVILVKHFFHPFDAGIYSALSTMGKIIFFATSAIASAMFPIVSELNEKNREHKSLLGKALLLVGFISIVILLFFFFAPTLIVKLFFGAGYLEAAKYLGIFGIFSVLLSLINVFIHYYLSINENSFIYFLGPVVFLEIILIFIFHSSIQDIVWILVSLMSLLFVSLYLMSFLKKKEV